MPCHVCFFPLDPTGLRINKFLVTPPCRHGRYGHQGYNAFYPLANAWPPSRVVPTRWLSLELLPSGSLDIPGHYMTSSSPTAVQTELCPGNFPSFHLSRTLSLSRLSCWNCSSWSSPRLHGAVSPSSNGRTRN